MSDPIQKPSRKSYFLRHWNGEFSLATSLFVTFWAPLLLLLLLALFLFGNLRLRGGNFSTQSDFLLMIFIAIFALLLLIAQIWGSVGTWRSSLCAWKSGRKTSAIISGCLSLVIAIPFGGVAILILGICLFSGRGIFDSPEVTLAKPVIYLYPQHKQEISVKLFYQGKLTSTYPLYDTEMNGWKVTAYPNGQLINVVDRQPYSYLFWEGIPDNMDYDMSTGFVVTGKDTAAFLQKSLKAAGLTPKEYNEFIVYWLPRMENNAYNFIHFAAKEYTDIARLEIDPKPDSLLRVFMVFKALEKPVDIPPQKIEPFARKGFAVVEWGGTEVK